MVSENNDDLTPRNFPTMLVPTDVAAPIVGPGSDSYDIRETILLQGDISNTDAICVGGEGVTPDQGIQIMAGTLVSFDVDDPQVLYCISASPNQRLRILGF